MKKLRLFSIGSLTARRNSAGQFPAQFLEGDPEHLLTPDNDIVTTGLHLICRHHANGFAKPSADAVADRRIADLLGDGQAISGREIVLAVQGLKQKQPSAALFTPPAVPRVLGLPTN
jgi:hypothetical protein